MEILTKLGINWQLLLAQLINFAILLAVLTRFVYRPFLNLLDSRTERIKKSMEDVKAIENQRRDMEQSKAEYMRKLDAEGAVFLERAKKEADMTKKEMMAGAQREVEEILKKGKAQLEDDKRKMTATMQNAVVTLSFKLAEKIIEREFSEADQKKILKSLENAIPNLVT